MDYRPTKSAPLSDLPLFAAELVDTGGALEHGPAGVEVPYQAHSTTSREAAAALRESGRAQTLEDEVLAFLAQNADGGLTDEEVDHLGRLCGLSFSATAGLRPRRVRLWHAGFVADSGERRLTTSGKRATVWRITEAGLQKWARLVAEERMGVEG